MEYSVHKRIGPRCSVVNSHFFGLYLIVVARPSKMEGHSALERIFSNSDDSSDEEMSDEDRVEAATDFAHVPHGLDLCLVSSFVDCYCFISAFKTSRIIQVAIVLRILLSHYNRLGVLFTTFILPGTTDGL